MEENNPPIPSNNYSKEPYKDYFLILNNSSKSQERCENCNNEAIVLFKIVHFNVLNEQNCEFERVEELKNLCQECYDQLKKEERIPKFLEPLYSLSITNRIDECIDELEKYPLNLESQLLILAKEKGILKENDDIEKLKGLSANERANLILDLLTEKLFGFNIFGKLIYVENDEEFYFLRNNLLIKANGVIKKLLAKLFKNIVTNYVERELFFKLLGIAHFISEKEFKKKLNPIEYIKFKNAIFDTINFEIVENIKTFFTYEIPWEIDTNFFDQLRKGLIDESYFENCLFYRLRRFYDDENWNKLILALGSIICYGLNERRRFFLIIGEKNTAKSTLKNSIEKALDQFAYEMSWSDLTTNNRFSFSFLAQGKRLGLLSEKPNITVSNVERLKAVLGDRFISVEQKFKNPIEVETRLRIIAFCNDIPNFKEIDDALLQRIMIIFTQSPLDEEEIDPNFENELMKEENIRDFLKFLLWCGYRYYLRSKVLTEDHEHLKELLIESKDFTIPFVKEACEEGQGFREKREDLYNAFRLWRKEKGLELNISNREFYAKMRLKYEEVRAKDGYYFKGLRIKPEYKKQDTLT